MPTVRFTSVVFQWKADRHEWRIKRTPSQIAFIIFCRRGIKAEPLELVVAPLIVIGSAAGFFRAAVGDEQSAMQLVHRALVFMAAFALRQRHAENPERSWKHFAGNRVYHHARHAAGTAAPFGNGVMAGAVRAFRCGLADGAAEYPLGFCSQDGQGWLAVKVAGGGEVSELETPHGLFFL